MNPSLQNLPSIDIPSTEDPEMGYPPVTAKRRTSFPNLPFHVDLGLVRMVLAEAVGTFILVFCIGGIMANMNAMGAESQLLAYAMTAGLSVVVIVYSIGPISGAHVNPSVTIAFAVLGPFPWSKVSLYILAQTGGSILGSYVGKLVYGIKPEALMTRPIQGCTAAFWVEVIAAFVILFLTASMLSEPNILGPVSGFIIGVAICLAVLICGPVSGGSMNPARSLGPAILAWKFDHLWIYLAAPTIGASLGVFMYRSLRLQGWSCKPQGSLPSSSHSPLL